MANTRKSEAVWKALANPVRRAMLDLLADAPQTTGQLVLHFPRLSRFAVMQHLKVLVQAELVLAQKLGRERYNYLNPVPLQDIYDRWVNRYVQPWAEALVGLRDQLEAEEKSA